MSVEQIIKVVSDIAEIKNQLNNIKTKVDGIILEQTGVNQNLNKTMTAILLGANHINENLILLNSLSITIFYICLAIVLLLVVFFVIHWVEKKYCLSSPKNKKPEENRNVIEL